MSLNVFWLHVNYIDILAPPILNISREQVHVPRLVKDHAAPFTATRTPIATERFENIGILCRLIVRGTELRLPTLPTERRLFLLAERDAWIAFARRTILEVRIAHAVFNMETTHRSNLAGPRVPRFFHARWVHAQRTRRPRK